MFTGIVEEVGAVRSVDRGGLTIAASRAMDDLAHGGSISVNGACLTVTSHGDSDFSVDVVPETLRCTNLGSLRAGDPVNLERSLPVKGRLDGHIVQGHVDGTGAVESITAEGDALLVRIAAPLSIMRYVVEKGFVAVDGASMTVVNCNGEAFVVTVVPYTRDNSLFGSRSNGDLVNLEVDIVAKYVDRLLLGTRAELNADKGSESRE